MRTPVTVLFSAYRSDPFAAARVAAGLEPIDRRPRGRGAGGRGRRRHAPLAVTAVVAAVATFFVGVGSPASAADGEVASRETVLRAATGARERAEQRVREAEQRYGELSAEVERLGETSRRLAEELATARQDLREYAVAAYIDGGQSEIFRASLSPEKAVALAWVSNLALGQSITADQAAGRFAELKRANDPELIQAAAELDRAGARLEEARFDAIQAAAHERDAESALTRAREAAERERAERARAERAAAAQRAAQREEARRASAAQRIAATTPQRAARAPQPAPAVTVRSSGGAGNPSGSETATLAKIRACESGGNYSAVSASGRYRGAYQFDRATWASVGGSGDPAAASPAEQDHRALLLLRQRGTRPWPVCGR